MATGCGRERERGTPPGGGWEKEDTQLGEGRGGKMRGREVGTADG
jgi:hypothetical protein